MLRLSIFAILSAAAVSAASAMQFTHGNARFIVLTDRMIRCEWSEDGRFEDRPSLVFSSRDSSRADATWKKNGAGITLMTGRTTLVWTGGAFSETNLFVNGVAVLAPDKENLYGTTRTLDGVNDFATLMPKMEKGLLSRRGVTVVDDTATPLFVDGWVAERPKRTGAYRDLTVFAYGHDYKACLRDYTRVAGKIPLPPRWAFGYWWSRYWLYTDTEIRELVDTMLSFGVPLDVFIIDMEWHETWGIGDRPDMKDEFGQYWGWTGYTWNRRLFPDPEATLAYLHSKGCKVALNLHPASGIQPIEECYTSFARDYGWQGTNAVPFKIEEKKWADCYFKTVLGPLEKEGVDFWWLDWQQWKMAKTMPSLSNTFWLNRVFFEKSRPGKRPFIYHRWGGLGSHRYQVGFSGDCKVAWKMLEAIPWFTATASNVGYGYWGHDIGGHHNPDGDDGLDGELFTRWLQSGVFTPIFKTHSTKDAAIERRIWKFPDHVLALRDAMRLRYRLAPYIYTAARQAYDTGVSMCRPFYYDWPEEDAAYEVKNAYMFGDDILAATISGPMDKEKGESALSIWLPPGEWYDVSKGELLQGGRTVEQEYAIDENPWFIKAGAIIPMYPAGVCNLANPGTDELELFFAPGANAEERRASIYEDDGDNADYAENFRMTTVTRTGNRIAISPRKGAYTLKFPCMAPPVEVKVNGVSQSWEYDANEMAIVIKTPPQDGARETVVEFTMPPDAEAIEKKLLGLKGQFRKDDAMAQELKVKMCKVHWAANLPDSFQVYWQTRAAIAADPANVAALLERREKAWKAAALRPQVGSRK